MHLKTQIDGALRTSVLPVAKFPASPLIARARKELEAKFSGHSAVPAQEQLDELAKRLLAATKRADWAGISGQDWRRAAWCLWLPGYELADHPSFLNAYLARLRQRHRRGAYGALVGTYFREFGARGAAFDSVAEAIREVVDTFQWPWTERHRRYNLFWPARAPESLADAFLAEPDGVAEIWARAGLTAEHGKGGFGRSVLGALLQVVKKRLRNGGIPAVALRELLKWTVDGKVVRFPSTEGILANALLQNWHSRDPDESVRSEIQEFLMRTLGDPRIKGGRWLGVAEDDKRVLLRWLVGASLEQFLQIVDRVAKPNHWDYRRAFWTAYHKAGVIDEAWVVFGRRGHDLARRSFQQSTGYGQLSGGEQTHAVLLLRINDLTIADWSHNGTCRIWTSSSRQKPKFYATHYDRSDLVEEANFSQMHHGSDRGTWQGSVAEYIRGRTGIALRGAQYMPR
jgi:hypothetical protein